ncbi:unnamed protein product [Closterium sp. NIES-53]
MYALTDCAKGDCYLSVPPVPGIEAATLDASACAAPCTGESAAPGAGESALSGTAPTEVLNTFTPDYGASRSSFRDSTTLTPLRRHVAVSLADPSGAQSLRTLPRFCRVLRPRRACCRDSTSPRSLRTWCLLRRPVLVPRLPPDHVVLCRTRLSFGTTALVTPPCLVFEGIRQTFTLPASPQQNGFAERRIGMVMAVARTSMIHAAAPHFLWTFAVQYAAHQINLQPRVSLPETTPTLRWMGKVGDASAFRVWGSRDFVRDTSADKLSSCAVPCVFLGFPPDAPGWQFYQPTPCYVLSRRHGPAPSGMSQVDPAEPVEVAVDSGAARGAKPAGAGTGGGTASGGAEPARTQSGGSPGVPLQQVPLSPHRLHEWYTRHSRRATGAASAGAARRAAGAGAAGGAAGAGAAGGASGAAGVPAGVGATGAAGPGGARIGGTGAAGAGGAAGVAVAGTGAGGAAGVLAGDPGAEGTGAVSAVSGGAARPRLYYVPLLQQLLGLPPSPVPSPPLLSPPPVQSQSQLQPASPLPGPSPYSGPTSGLTERHESESLPLSPETRPASPESRSALPVRIFCAGRRVSLPRPPSVPSTHSMTLRPSTAPQRVPLPSSPASSLPALVDPESNSLRAISPTVTRLLATAVTDPLFESRAASALVAELGCTNRQEEFECFAAAVPHLVSMLLGPEGDPDVPDILTPRSYAEAIEGPYSSQWQAAMDAEMASWKSTGTYVDEVLLPGANIVSGMWIFRVKRPPDSPPVFKVRYVARGFSQRQGVDFFHTFSPTPKMTTLRVLLHVAAQRDYELHSLDFSIAFLRGSLHEEIWLRRPPGFTGSFSVGTQWSLRQPVYGLRQAPREWHDTLRTTLATLGLAPSSADPSLFLRTDTTPLSFYVLVYVDDLIFAPADTEAPAHVKSELQKRHTCTDLGELTSYLGLRITRDRAQRTITLTQSHMVQHVLLRFSFTYSSPQSTPLPTSHSLSAPPSDESVEPSGPYPELVGCLITSGMGLLLGGRARVVLTGHADASKVDDLATGRSSQGSSWEAQIYAGAMAAQELRWLTYLLTDLGEAPRSPPQRGQRHLAYVASQANTADVFTKALQPCDHQLWGAEPASVEPGGAEPGGAEPGGAEPGGADPEGAERGGAESEGAASGDAEPGGTKPEGAEPGGGGVTAGGGTGVAGAGGPGGVRTRGSGAAGAGGVGGTGAGDPKFGGTGAGGTGAGGAGAGDPGAGGAGAGGTGAGGAGADPGAGGAGAGGAASGGIGAGCTVQRRMFFVPPPPSSLPPPDSVLRQVLSLPSSSGLSPSFLSPPPRQSQPQLQPDFPLLAPSPYAKQKYSFTERREPESCPALPVRVVRTGRRVPRPRPPLVPGTHVMALSHAASPTIPRLLATVVADPLFESTAASALVAELVDFAVARHLDYAAILFAYAHTGIRTRDLRSDTMVLRPPGSPPVFKARYVAQGFSQRQGVDFFQTFSPTPKMTTLQGSLHEEIWLRRPPGFTGSFPAGTQWSLRRLVYGLRLAPREWHNTLRMTLAALGFAPSTPTRLYFCARTLRCCRSTSSCTSCTSSCTSYYTLCTNLRHGQARLDFVALEANIVDVFTKALVPGDHHRLVEVCPRLL